MAFRHCACAFKDRFYSSEGHMQVYYFSDFELRLPMSSQMMPCSPKPAQVNKLRQAMYKKSPVRSPLREVLKSRCQERMKANRANVVGRMRNIKAEDERDIVEREIRELVRVCLIIRF